MIDHKIHAVLRPTRAYSSFSFNDYNRDVIPSHVDRLEEAVAEQNLLDLYPLVTTAERVIVDGQNRFCMARNLMIPFYYMASDHLGVADIMSSNELSLSYNERDAMYAYTHMGVEPYVIAAEFMERFKKATDSTIGTAVGLLSKHHSKISFVRGDLVIDQRTWAEKMAVYITDFKEYCPVFDGAYQKALKRIVLTGKYDHEQMMSKVEWCSKKMLRCAEWRHAVAVLQEVYNFRTREQYRIDFLALVDERKMVPTDDIVFTNQVDTPLRQIEGQKETVVYTTNNYNLFSVHPSLRPLREVDALRDYMQQKNLLQYYPIIVNEKYQILDGQRRFAAAKQLGLPIYFIVSSNFSVWMAIIAGGTRKDWSLGDYLKSYAKQGLPEYVWAETMQERYSGLTPVSLIRAHPGRHPVHTRNFRLGQVKFDHQYIESFCRQWANVNSERRWKHQPLLRAAFSICDFGKSMDRLPRLIQIVNRNWDILSAPMSSTYATELLRDLYNKALKTADAVPSRSTVPSTGVYRPQPAA